MPRHPGVSKKMGLEFYPFLFYILSVNENLKNRRTDQQLLRLIVKEFSGCESVYSSMKLSTTPSPDPRVDKTLIPLNPFPLYLTTASIAKLKQWRSMYNRGQLVELVPRVFSCQYMESGIRKIAGSVNLTPKRIYEKIEPLVPDDPRIQTGTFIDYKPQSHDRG